MIIQNIINQHAEEASFLWLQRDTAVQEPHYSLEDLVKLDNRIEANIDGLRIAGDEGWQICKEQLAWEEAGEVFVGAVLAFENGDESRIQEVIELGSSNPELARGIISALGWLSFEQAEKHIQKLLSADSSELRRIGIAASAIHRHNPGSKLSDAVKNDDPLLKARALKAAGELGRSDLGPFLQYSLNSKDEECQFYAAWSATLLGLKEALPVLKTIALKDESYSEESVKMALRLMDPVNASGWIKELAQSPEHIYKAVIGTGIAGDPVMIPWLITLMDNNEIARVAGESFTMITGVDLAYEDLEGEWPEGFEAGPTESPEDEDVELDPDEDLPWPEQGLIQKWWDQNNGSFQEGKRYLSGKPITTEWCQQVLREGKQRQRAAAATELAISNPGQPLFEVRAPGFRQKQILASEIP